jgi:hypothetical protein
MRHKWDIYETNETVIFQKQKGLIRAKRASLSPEEKGLTCPID